MLTRAFKCGIARIGIHFKKAQRSKQSKNTLSIYKKGG